MPEYRTVYSNSIRPAAPPLSAAERALIQHGWKVGRRWHTGAGVWQKTVTPPASTHDLRLQALKHDRTLAELRYLGRFLDETT